MLSFKFIFRCTTSIFIAFISSIAAVFDLIAIERILQMRKRE